MLELLLILGPRSKVFRHLGHKSTRHFRPKV